MSYADYLKVLEKYYKLKRKYQIKLENVKKTNKKLSLAEKKEKIDKFKEQRKCINCKKIGGSIFTEKKNKLKVVCGSKKPCKLHIELQKPEYFYIPEMLDKKTLEIKNIKQEIIEYKMDLLFGLQQEEVVLAQFKSLRE